MRRPGRALAAHLSRSAAAVYEELADVTFDTSTGPLAGVVADIVAWARTEQDAEEHA